MMHADHETTDHRSGPALNSKDVPQFAPNFTVYLLPPDAVCLYSEHRKFFLYGELYCALASAIGEGDWTLSASSFADWDEFSDGQDSRSPDAAVRPRLCPAGLARLHRRRRRLLGKPRPVTAGRAEKSPGLPRPHSIDRRAGCEGACRRAHPARRSRRAALARPDCRAGGRLSRRAPGRTEQAAPVGSHTLAAGPALRHFSAGRAGVHPGKERLLDMSCPIACGATARSRGCSTAARRAACRPRRSPASHSDKTASSLQPSRSRRRSPRVLRLT